MNVFYLDESPVISAKLQCDKHIVKMPTEMGQMLSTAHRELDGNDEIEYRSISLSWKNEEQTAKKFKKIKLLPHFNEKHHFAKRHVEIYTYRSAHVNHPSTKWVRENSANYQWALTHLKEMLMEYSFRYNKVHGVESVMHILENIPKNIKQSDHITPMAMAMPEEFQSSDIVSSYREFYNSKDFKMIWTKRKTPEWYKNES
jgi:hypothetical protein